WSEGDDTNPGTQAEPVKTFLAAKKLIDTGGYNFILLKRGDTWKITFNNYDENNKPLSGQSAQKPLVLGAYGEGERPIIEEINGGTAVYLDQVTKYFALVGVHLKDTQRPPFGSGSTGVGLVGNQAGYISVIDCYIEQFSKGITIHTTESADENLQRYIPNVTVRDSIIVENYKQLYPPNGIYLSGIDGILLEGNVFDKNGRKADGSGGTVHDHNVYLTGKNKNIVVRNNIFANAAHNGLQARSGGVIENNFFYNNPIHLDFGLVNGEGPVSVGGVTGRISGNVMIGTRNVGSMIENGQRGYGIQVANVLSATISNNIIAFNNVANTDQAALTFQPGYGTFQDKAIGVRDVIVAGNIIYDWTTPLVIKSLRPTSTGKNFWSNVTFRNNDLAGADLNLMKTADGKTNLPSIIQYEGKCTAQHPNPGVVKESFDSFIINARNEVPGYTAAAAIAKVRAGFGNCNTSL
ncbi:right-handed parallel beta-helix repeat-containing protein, partial [Candidatus Pacearchaeota archaeon]|nr:right-handed parallel beta-helix repeat-containing protein [Candidatus Pacearchaeota archaeon]